MTKDTKIIVGLTCFGFAMLHILLLGYVSMMLRGEDRGWAFIYLEWPVAWTWPGGEASLSDFRFWSYFTVVGSLFYALFVGVPVGFTICGIRRLFKWLNDDKWNRNA